MPTRDDFNNDVMLPKRSERGKDNSTLRELRKHFPDLLFAADFPAFRRRFHRIDDEANTQKRASRLVGFVAVAFGACALFLAAASPIYPNSEEAHEHLSLLAIVLGLSGAVTAYAGISIVQKDWLRRRYCTERARQFFFQNMVFRMPELVGALNGGARDRIVFEDKSLALLRQFWAEEIDGSAVRLAKVVEGEPKYDADWLMMRYDAALTADDERIAASLHDQAARFYELYRLLRLDLQEGYAKYKIRPGGEIRFQERWLGTAALGAIVLSFVMHFALGGALGFGWKLGTLGDVIVVWIALLGLVVKAVEEGLQPKREAERYEDYRANCQLAMQRFDAASTAREKFNAMLDFERVAYEEMKHFLRTNYHAHFIV